MGWMNAWQLPIECEAAYYRDSDRDARTFPQTYFVLSVALFTNGAVRSLATCKQRRFDAVRSK